MHDGAMIATDAMPTRPAMPEPWTPAEATTRLNQIAKDPDAFNVSFKLHAFDQMDERDITTADVQYVMRTGFVYEPAVPATQPGLFRYKIKGPTPSSNNREVCVVVIPSMHKSDVKIITVMWADEPLVRG
jgi:hypothetical protein